MDIEFGAILGAVSSGKADFTMAGLTVTEERKQSVDFSSSYATGIQSIIVKEDSPIATVDDLLRRRRGLSDRRPAGHHGRYPLLG